MRCAMEECVGSDMISIEFAIIIIILNIVDASSRCYYDSTVIVSQAIQLKQEVKMKVKIKSILKFSTLHFKWVEDNMVSNLGNNLCIGEFAKTPSDFIPLHINNSHLYHFTVSNNANVFFTAENNALNNRIEVCSYTNTAQPDRKMFPLSEHPNFMPIETLASLQLLPDEFESSIIYVIAKNKQNEFCVSLIDLAKGRMLAHGWVGQVNSFRTRSMETFEVSVAGKYFLRRLKAQDGLWNVEERLPKRLHNVQILEHEWLPGDRLMVSTNNTLHLIEGNDIIQSIPICSGSERVTHLRKINKGLLIFTNQLTFRFYVEEGDDGFYILSQTLDLPFKLVQTNPNIPILEEPEEILQVEINKTEQNLFILTSKGKFYFSKIDNFSGANKEGNFLFELKENKNYLSTQVGDINTSNGQSYGLLSTENKIELWDLEQVTSLISLDFSSLETKKIIRSSALNPDGHSFCVGFHDKIKFYKILINKFQQFAEYPLKKTKIIQYSHGGQLLACVSGKGAATMLTIFNTLSMKQVHVFKLGYPVRQVIWNEYDDEIYVSGSESKTLSIFKVSSKSKLNTFCLINPIDYMRYDYSTRRILVSSGGKIISIVNNEDLAEIDHKLKNFHYVFPIEGCYLGTDTKGNLYTSKTIDFEKSQQISLFQNEEFKLKYQKGLLIAYTDPSNAVILRVKSLKESQMPEKNNSVVLVEREEINKFLEKVKLLESQLEQMQNMTGIKLEEEKKKYNENLEEHAQRFQQEMSFLQKRMNELQTEKNHQEKDNARVFEQLQTGQIKSVNDLEKVYDLKIRLQKEKYLALEQDHLEQKIRYENIIKDLETRYHEDINKVREEYSKKLEQEVKHMEHEKSRNLEYKRKVETKLINLEEESELTLLEIQLSKDNRIKNLIEKHTKLEREHDATLIELHNLKEDLDVWKQNCKNCEDKMKESEKVIKESSNRVRILEGELEKKIQVIEDKNTSIEQQAHQIEALEKAKYVLSFRTTEIRKGLEPKDALIDKLKSEFFKLEEEYKKENHKNFELSQRLEKIQKLSTTIRKENNELKNSLKLKDRLHEELCYELFVLVNNVDPKDWNAGIVKLYQGYAHEEKHKNKTQKKDDNTSQEINRHLIHVEQSLHQVATGNEKMLKGKEKEVVRKMKENAELIYDLNNMKKELNIKESDLEEKRMEIAKLKRELHESTQGHRTTRANTANTGITRRIVSRDPAANQGQKADWIDLSIKRQSEYLVPDRNTRSRVHSAHKTMVWREDSRKDRSKLSDLAKELESAKNTMKRQDRMIEELNQRLLGIPQDQLS